MLYLPRLTFLLTRRQVAGRQIVCSLMWIPSFLFPPKAGVLLHNVTSRRTLRRSGRYVCIMLHVRVASCLTMCINLHSPQKASASQPLPLEMEKAGGKRDRSASPSSARQTRSTQRLKVPCLFVSQIILEISKKFLRNFFKRNFFKEIS